MITFAFLALVGSAALAPAAGQLLVAANVDRFVLVFGYGNNRRRSVTVLLVVGILSLTISATAITVHYVITSWLGPACLLGYAVLFAAPVALHNRRLSRARAGLPPSGIEVTRADTVPTLVAFAGIVGGVLLGTGVGGLLFPLASSSHPLFDTLLIVAGAVLVTAWLYARYGPRHPAG